MQQRRLSLKAPKNEIPAPGDKRLKAYKDQQTMDKRALALVAEGHSLEEAYRKCLSSTQPQPALFEAEPANSSPGE